MALAMVRALGIDAVLASPIACVVFVVAFVDVLTDAVVHTEAVAALASIRTQCVLADGVLLGACVV